MLSADAVTDDFGASFYGVFELHWYLTGPAADAAWLLANPTLIEPAGAGVAATRYATISGMRSMGLREAFQPMSSQTRRSAPVSGRK